MKMLDIEASTLVIAEIGLSHEGSLGLAFASIDAVAESGADAVKFQTHIAEAESSEKEPWRVKFSKQDERRIDYWQRTAFTEEQWCMLKEHAEKCGLLFLSSPFSTEAVDMLERIGVHGWKIASGELTNDFMMERICLSSLPVLVSTGMARMNEIEAIVKRFRQADLPFSLLQCTSMYPTSADKLGLNVLTEYREKFNCTVGLSDHSGNIYACLAAPAHGATIFEVHTVFSRKMFGPDVPSSIEFDDLRRLVEGIKYIRTALDNPVDKDSMADELTNMRGLFTKSLVASRDIAAGEELNREMVMAKKPGTGISVENAEQYYGCTLSTDIASGHYFEESDFILNAD